MLGFPPEVCSRGYFDELNFDGTAVADHCLPSLNLTWDGIREIVASASCEHGMLDVGASMSSLTTEAILRGIDARATDILYPWHPSKKDFIEFIPKNLRAYAHHLRSKPRSSQTAADKETLRLLSSSNLGQIKHAVRLAADGYVSIAAEDLSSVFPSRSVALVVAGCSVPKHSGSIAMFKRQLVAMLAVCEVELRLYPFEIEPTRGHKRALYKDEKFLSWVKETIEGDFSFELETPTPSWDQKVPEDEPKVAIFRRIH